MFNRLSPEMLLRKPKSVGKILYKPPPQNHNNHKFVSSYAPVHFDPNRVSYFSMCRRHHHHHHHHLSTSISTQAKSFFVIYIQNCSGLPFTISHFNIALHEILATGSLLRCC